ncbi:MAG: restriction endonuclease [Candidatus Bathyarchaeota archaeon]|nr:restriction endonuclease [Candidatus Bathyarchaeota archaeon]
MSVERNLAISLLKLTQNGPALIEAVKIDAHLPLTVVELLLQKMQKEELINLRGNSVEADSGMRLRLAVRAVSLGADVEALSRLLRWQEFEEIAAIAFQTHGYTVQNNVRFKGATRRWEIDVVACKKPLVVCIDCKHWQHAIKPAQLRQIVDLQVQRTEDLADALPNPKLKLSCIDWEKAKFVPAVLALFPSVAKLQNRVPVVPVLQLQDFLSQLPGYLDSLHVHAKAFRKLA